MAREVTDTPNVRVIPSGALFQIGEDGPSFHLPLLDTIYEWRELADAMKAEGKTHHDYLKELVRRMANRTDLTLTLDQADWLNDQVEIEYAEFKKKRRDEWQRAQPLPSSTESTPSS